MFKVFDVAQRDSLGAFKVDGIRENSVIQPPGYSVSVDAKQVSDFINFKVTLVHLRNLVSLM